MYYCNYIKHRRYLFTILQFYMHNGIMCILITGITDKQHFCIWVEDETDFGRRGFIDSNV